MSIFLNKKRLFLTYAFFFLWAIAAFFITRNMAVSPWIIMITFFLMLFWPGFSLTRIFKIEPSKSSDHLILWLTLGFVYGLFISLVAMFSGRTLPFLVNFYEISLVFLFFLAFVLELFRPQPKPETPLKINFKEMFSSKNLIYLFLIVFLFLIFCVIDQQGTNLRGDPYYHLGIMRKVIEGEPLTSQNLNYVKYQTHPAYGFPIWHIFLGILTKITKTNIFIIFSEMSLSLTVLSILVWYWLFRIIFPSKNMAILSLFLYVIFTFSWTHGYLFTRMPVPDTLGQLFLLPLSVAFGLNYVLDKKAGYKILLILSIFVLLMGIIHLPQYFYYLCIMVVALMTYAIFNFRSEDFKNTLKKFLGAIFANILLILPFALFLQAQNQIVTTTFKGYRDLKTEVYDFVYDRFKNIRLTSKLAYVALPFTLLFIKKYPKLIYLFAFFLSMPIIYHIVPLKLFLLRTLGPIFIYRLYGNVTWAYMVWALVIGFGLILIDRLITKIGKISKYIVYLIDLTFLILAIWLVRFEVITKYGKVSVLNQKLLLDQTNLDIWLGQNFIWLMLGAIAIAIGLYVLQRYWKKMVEFFSLTEYRNNLTIFLLTFSIIFFFVSPELNPLLSYFKYERQNHHFVGQPIDSTYMLINPANLGGMETVDFIKNNIPPKSIFDTNGGYYLLPLLVDQHMSDYYGNAEQAYSLLYQDETPIENKVKRLAEGQIQYILYLSTDPVPIQGNLNTFDKHPEYFTKISENHQIYATNSQWQTTAIIYQVNTKQVQKDAAEFSSQ